VVWCGHVGGREEEALGWWVSMPVEKGDGYGGQKEKKERQPPFVGCLAPAMACITLPFSSAMSRTQSVLPVATRTWVLHPLTKPYSSSASSILNPLGYWIEQLLQSWSQSSPSTALSTTGNSSCRDALLPELPMASDLAPLMSDLSAAAIFIALPLSCAVIPQTPKKPNIIMNQAGRGEPARRDGTATLKKKNPNPEKPESVARRPWSRLPLGANGAIPSRPIPVESSPELGQGSSLEL
jgi:hypothetical protein